MINKVNIVIATKQRAEIKALNDNFKPVNIHNSIKLKIKPEPKFLNVNIINLIMFNNSAVTIENK